MEKVEIRKLADRYQSYYAGRIDRDLCKKIKKLPKFEIGEDHSAWTGPKQDKTEVIHVGLGLFNKFPDETEVCIDESDFHVTMRFLTGHEAGHQKYTTNRSFASTIQNCFMEFVDFAVKEVTGKSMRLVKDSDYMAALDYLRRSYGVAISGEAARNMIHSIVNAIEDGRMERCNIAEKPGYQADVVIFRGKTWIHTPLTATPDLKDPRDVIICVHNQILSLATTGVWQKGFLQYIAGTEIVCLVRQFIPDIEAAITSMSCARGMRYAKKIVTRLYPLLLEACKLSDFEKMMLDLYQKIKIMIPDFDPHGNNPHSYSASEKEDAVREKKDENGKLKVNIFAETSSDEGTDNGAETEGRNSVEGRKNILNSHNTSTSGSSGSKGQELPVDPEDDSAVILASMQAAAAAAEMAAEAAKVTVSASDVADSNLKESNDNSLARDVVNNKILERICYNFHEYMHVYELKEDLPIYMKQECAIIRRQYEQYFKSRKKPVRRNQKYGKIDPHQLSRLVRGDLDVYRKSEKDDTFSGCIEIFLDNSGSMYRTKRDLACETLARIEEYLKGLIPIKICAFDSSSAVNIEIIKNWNEVHKKNCTWNFKQFGRSGGGTPTMEVLLIGAEEMKKRQEHHKLILLLTDENSSCGNDRLKSAIMEIRAIGIQLCGIYFENNITDKNQASFLDLFDNQDAVVCKPEEIGNCLLPVIKHFTEQR